MPTDAQRAGDLSGGNPIFDPLTTRTDPVTGNVIRDPFPGNIIPTNRLSAQSLKALTLMYPRAQQQIPNVFNSVFNPKQKNNIYQYVGRFDYYATEKDRIWGRFAQWTNPSILPVFLSGGV